jgi:hypothetical protein
VQRLDQRGITDDREGGRRQASKGRHVDSPSNPIIRRRSSDGGLAVLKNGDILNVDYTINGDSQNGNGLRLVGARGRPETGQGQGRRPRAHMARLCRADRRIGLNRRRAARGRPLNGGSDGLTKGGSGSPNLHQIQLDGRQQTIIGRRAGSIHHQVIKQHRPGKGERVAGGNIPCARTDLFRSRETRRVDNRLLISLSRAPGSSVTGSSALHEIAEECV